MSLLTCKIHKSALEYSIIRRYTNVVYYYYYLRKIYVFNFIISKSKKLFAEMTLSMGVDCDKLFEAIPPLQMYEIHKDK